MGEEDRDTNWGAIKTGVLLDIARFSFGIGYCQVQLGYTNRGITYRVMLYHLPVYISLREG